jgi:nucleolar protein 56
MLFITTWFGTFLLDPESGDIIKQILFPKDASELAVRLEQIQTGGILAEEKKLLKGINDSINVTEPRLKALGNQVDAVLPLSENIELTPEEFQFDPGLYHKAILELGKLRIKQSVGKDHFIIQAVNGLDDLNQTANLLSERLHEWYGLHWPELEWLVKDTEYVTLISGWGDKQTILETSDIEELKSLNVSDSVGSMFESEDKEAVMGFAKQLKYVLESKSQLENYITQSMESIAPNMTSITGPIIGARLIALTGSLSRLAKVTSSTIQLLGAEKALFRHLRDGEAPPKHGIIFQHPLIHNAPYWQRGKIARAFAGKISIATKLDFNSDKVIGDELADDLKRRIDEIKKKYPSAPPKKKRWNNLRTGGGKGLKGKRTRRGKRKKGKR